jgi:outer membrane receptor protein involved in Fe transport
MKRRSLVIGLLLLGLGTGASAHASDSGQQPTGQPPPAQQPPTEQEEPPVYTEAVVVTASKVEQQIVNAPATVSVITSDTIQSSPSNNFAELLRSVPGMNITQTSARDYNLNMRGATSTLSTSQLAVLDSRSLYLDFFGFIAWDLVPVNTFELKQIEVIRGPASAVWGANALSGVVNFISKTPRELNSNNLSINFGGMNRSPEGGQQLGTGSIYSINVTHAKALNDRTSRTRERPSPSSSAGPTTTHPTAPTSWYSRGAIRAPTGSSTPASVRST